MCHVAPIGQTRTAAKHILARKVCSLKNGRWTMLNLERMLSSTSCEVLQQFWHIWSELQVRTPRRPQIMHIGSASSWIIELDLLGSLLRRLPVRWQILWVPGTLWSVLAMQSVNVGSVGNLATFCRAIWFFNLMSFHVFCLKMKDHFQLQSEMLSRMHYKKAPRSLPMCSFMDRETPESHRAWQLWKLFSRQNIASQGRLDQLHNLWCKASLTRR